MEIFTKRFGAIDIHEEDIITFPEGLPGLEALHRYILLDETDIPMLHWMQSLDDANIVLPVLNVFDVCPSYVVDIDDEEAADLGGAEARDLLLMNVCVIPEDMLRMTVNLAAPVLINVKSKLGKQIVLCDAKYSTRYPIFEEFYRVLKKGA